MIPTWLTVTNISLVGTATAAAATILGHVLPASPFQRACLAFGVNFGRILAELQRKPDPTASAVTTQAAPQAPAAPEGTSK